MEEGNTPYQDCNCICRFTKQLLQGRGNKSSDPRERDLKPRNDEHLASRCTKERWFYEHNNSQELCKRWPINRRTADESSGTLRQRCYTSKGKGKGKKKKKKKEKRARVLNFHVHSKTWILAILLQAVWPQLSNTWRQLQGLTTKTQHDFLIEEKSWFF
jgi:hypothetical protein